MMAKKGGLGRGLDSLIPIGIMEETEEVEREVADRKAARAKAAKAANANNGKTAANSNAADIKHQKSNLEGGREEGVPSNREAKAVEIEKDEIKTNDSTANKTKADQIKTNETKANKIKTNETKPNETEANEIKANDIKADEANSNKPQASGKEPEEKKGIVTLKLTEIEPNRNQPRKDFNEDALQELAESIRIHGVIQPLLVQKKGDYYEIIAGERRWRAAKTAGLKEVPAVIREYTPREVMEISLIENIQREDLNAIEEAKAYQWLIQEFHLKQEEIAVKISKSRTAIANTMRLLKLDERVQTMLIEDEISSGHARALLPLEDGELQYSAAQKIASESLSVRETEKLVKLLQMPPKEEKPPVEEERDDSFIYQALEEKMKTIMGTKVTIHKKDNNKGRIEIEYYSPDELERIVDLMETIK